MGTDLRDAATTGGWAALTVAVGLKGLERADQIQAVSDIHLIGSAAAAGFVGFLLMIGR